MFRTVPASTTAGPFESAPILTSVYCAASCSCRDGAWALARDIGIIVAARNAIPTINARNFCGMMKPSGSAFSQENKSISECFENAGNTRTSCPWIGHLIGHLIRIEERLGRTPLDPQQYVHNKRRSADTAY